MGRRSRICCAACILAGLGVLASGGQAAAQSDGVVVDPDSPAGKEYALPLDKARQDVAPAPDAGATGSEEADDAPLFGAGISKRKGGQGGGGDGRDGSDQRDDRDSAGSREDVAGGGSAVTAAASASGSGLSSGWLTALVAFGVLLAGGIVGLSLRALRSGEPD